jgi:hypothetical protein
MTTNVPGTRDTPPANEPLVSDPKLATPPVTNPAGVSGVAVFDQSVDKSTEPSANSSVAVFDSAPAKSQSSGNVIAWVIGIVVLIVLAYFLLQFLF